MSPYFSMFKMFVFVSYHGFEREYRLNSASRSLLPYKQYNPFYTCTCLGFVAVFSSFDHNNGALVIGAVHFGIYSRTDGNGLHPKKCIMMPWSPEMVDIPVFPQMTQQLSIVSRHYVTTTSTFPILNWYCDCEMSHA